MPTPSLKSIFKPASAYKGRRRLLIDLHARQKCGKTYFALNAPRPHVFLNFDAGLESVIEKFDRDELYVEEFRHVIEANEGLTAKANDEVLTRLKQKYAQALNYGAQSITIDTGSEAFDLVKYARFGRLTQIQPHHYGALYAEFGRMVKDVYNSECNLILLHRSGKEYINTGKTDKHGNEVRKDTGAYIRQGYKGGQFDVQLAGRLEAVPDTGTIDNPGRQLQLVIEDCRASLDLIGTVLPQELITFADIAQLVYPDSDPEEWGPSWLLADRES